MENLLIEHKGQAVSRKIVGGIWILYAVVSLVIELDSLEAWDWLKSIAFFIIGIIFFTPLAGSNKSQIKICEGCLKIIWITWIRKVTILETEIESILLAKNGILINREGKKAVKLFLNLMGKEQKKQVYSFFTEYAHQKNFVLKR